MEWDFAWEPPPPFYRHLATREKILPEPLWRRVSEEACRLTETERSYLPVHKQGGMVAYETLQRAATAIVGLYRSATFRGLVSRIVGVPLQQTPEHDQISCSVLFYERPGDHIGWHYDHNFYRGRHFTVLIPILNRGREEGSLSSARLMARLAGEEVVVPSAPNTLILFEGAKVRHKVTPLAEGERRVVLSMTYCSDPRNSAWQGIARRVKDTAFFGMRALWT